MGEYADYAIDAALHSEMLFIDEEEVWMAEQDGDEIPHKLRNTLAKLSTYELQAADSAGFPASVHSMIRAELGRRTCRPEEWRWVSGGRAIRLPDMTTAHIRNSIAYMERNGRGSLPVVSAMRVELSRRPI